MLVEEYNEKREEHECYDPNRKWVVLTGYGATKEAARVAYFKINIVKCKAPIINMKAT